MTKAPSERLAEMVHRLSASSERHFYNPYDRLQWPPSLPDDQYWMPPELLTTAGTAVDASLTEQQRWALSKWESINFYSLNVHGIRELLIEVVNRIHLGPFAPVSEYLHHVVGEENGHMWFFAKFCNLYGAKIYPSTAVHLPASEDPLAQDLLVFARLLIFEELVDVVNRRTAEDDRIDRTIRELNGLHHRDESRHIAFGRSMVEYLFEQFREQATPDQLADVQRYLERFMQRSVDSLCNPSAYRDAGIPEPYRVRREVLADPAHEALAESLLGRTHTFLKRAAIFSASGNLAS